MSEGVFSKDTVLGRVLRLPLKLVPATAAIPVILLTILDKKALGFRLGASAYLLKPLDPIAVRDTLNRVIIKDDRQKRVLVVDDDPTVADLLRRL